MKIQFSLCSGSIQGTLIAACVLSFALLIKVPPAAGQGMPAEQRDRIHRLAAGHKDLKRTVTLTEKGYTAETVTENAALAGELKAHVSYMSKRLKDGLRVRNWDPAFAEYVNHYDDLEHKFEPIEKGIRVTVTGKTDAAVRIAKQHAKIISDFVFRGPDALHETHPVEEKAEKKATPGTKSESPGSAAPEQKEVENKKTNDARGAGNSQTGSRLCPKCEDSEPKKGTGKAVAGSPAGASTCPKCGGCGKNRAPR